MELSIQEVARITGTTSRTLRHYGDVGLLAPSRVGANGYRYYDRDAMVRLQRILLLRELGLGLPAIAEVLARQTDVASALAAHIGSLRRERERIDRRVRAIEHTLSALSEGAEPMAEEMFDGFDNTRYREEVERRWGKDAYARGAAWWDAKTGAEQAEWRRDLGDLLTDWARLAESGTAPDGPEAAALAARHVAWLTAVPGTPGESGDAEALRNYVLGLAAMYVGDPRFAANFGGERNAEFVQRALEHHAATAL
ncbi:TipAS antibiotic-recognition domain-containing protein [Actinocorallia sp. API 0066]|uniref:MerR family transcriptional regulator n=1 Tax=Actinocorallia sp. API 0066 TaxID=2896846 RepID=UPI001E2EE40C|nr:TipAS antibiotic-recognition domain-containing protein [Actinocorallia sp. API 0066]MCD0451585.1 TipAS antibiotic-recognition domain-containing protein [Actinocorallia sp. API 0066]